MIHNILCFKSIRVFFPYEHLTQMGSKNSKGNRQKPNKNLRPDIHNRRPGYRGINHKNKHHPIPVIIRKKLPVIVEESEEEDSDFDDDEIIQHNDSEECIQRDALIAQNQVQTGVFSHTKIILFSEQQKIDEIRSRPKKFVDDEFKLSIELLINEPSDDMGAALAKHFDCTNVQHFVMYELTEKVRFKRCQVNIMFLLNILNFLFFIYFCFYRQVNRLQ